MSAALLTPIPTTLETARLQHAQNHLLQAAQAYSETLLTDPQNHTALLGLSLLARQSGQPQAALSMAQAALAAQQNSPLAWANCGDILLALSEPALAQSSYRHALQLDPALAAAHFGLGNALASQEDYNAAAPHFARALQQATHCPEVHFALAFALAKLARFPHALALYRQAIQLRPTFAAAWLNLGVALIAHGLPQLAPPCYTQALTAEPENHQVQISAHLNLGHLLRSQGDFAAAQQHYESALNLVSGSASLQDPSRLPEVHIAFTYLHLEQNHFPQAHHALRQAQAADPSHENPEIPNARGILLLAEDSATSPLRPPQVPTLAPETDLSQSLTQSLSHQAITAFTHAESLGHKTAPSNRGNALLRLGRLPEALAAHEKAVALDPLHPGLRYNLALTQLRSGDFLHGWLNYEARWLFREVHPSPRLFAQPRWQGSPVPALLVYCEQGLGDTLQYLRFLPQVAQRLSANPSQDASAPGPDPGTCVSPQPRLILEVQPALMRLLTPWLHHFRQSHSALTIQLLPLAAPLPPFTHHIPLLSLPALFETTLETIPTPIPYLFPDPQLTAQRAAELPQHSRPKIGIKKIGINWAGNPLYRADHERSTHLSTFRPLLHLPHILWVSLQNGPAAAQIAQLPQLSRAIQLINASENDLDLASTAALIANLDLIITTDTAIAHLAGALAKPLWLLLPWQSDWRWMQHTLSTPWYPSARLFRQSSPHNWPELIDRVSHELRLWLSSNHPNSHANSAPAARL